MRQLLLIVILLSAFLFFPTTYLFAQQRITLAGKIVDEKRREAVPFSTVLLKEHNLWSVSDESGAFVIHKIPIGKVTIEVHCLGYATQKMELNLRLDNNAAMDETLAPATRNLSLSDIESVEIISGVPSVEYGDLSNGIIKIKSRQGKSPFVVEGKLNQHTRQIALNKGFDLGRNSGILNTSLEYARSFSDIASPYTAYRRNSTA